MVASLVALLLAAPVPLGAAKDGFVAIQYQSSATRVHCLECAGASPRECAVPSLQLSTLDAPAAAWSEQGRLKLVGSTCAVDGRAVYDGSGEPALAALRIASEPPGNDLLRILGRPPALKGWPTPLRRRAGKKRPPDERIEDAAMLRLSVLCWPVPVGWPASGQPRLTPLNACEWWLLPFERDAAGQLEPALEKTSYLVVPTALDGQTEDTSRKRFAAIREWPAVFNPGPISLEAALVAGWTDPTHVLTAPAERVEEHPTEAAPPPQARAAAAAPVDGAHLEPCKPGFDNFDNKPVLDRFDAWAARFVRREGDAPLWQPVHWTGRCSVYETLRGVLEETLQCRLPAGRCARPLSEQEGQAR